MEVGVVLLPFSTPGACLLFGSWTYMDDGFHFVAHAIGFGLSFEVEAKRRAFRDLGFYGP